MKRNQYHTHTRTVGRIYITVVSDVMASAMKATFCKALSCNLFISGCKGTQIIQSLQG